MKIASKWIVMAVLGLSGTVIFTLPFLREFFYEPLRQSLHLSNTQSGLLMATYGAASLVAYPIGGWLADRVSSRLLIALSLVTTGLLGFILATLPSFQIALLIHAIWGFSTVGMMWGAMMKATRDWASADQQGQAFGLLEAGRGLSEAALASLMVAAFAWLGGDIPAFSKVIIIYSTIHLALAYVVWRTLEPDRPQRDDDSTKFGIADLFLVLKMPSVWLIAIVVLTSYSAYWGAFYFTPYASEVFGMSVVAAGFIAAGKVWLKPIFAAAAGFAADRIGIWQTVTIGFVVLMVSFAGFAMLSGGASLVGLMIVNIVIASIAIFAHRGIYFALLEECRISPKLTGSAVGVISMIGYTPDIFMPLLGGVLLDDHGGARGYQIYFGIISGLCLLGLLATWQIGRIHGRAALSR